MFLDKGRA